MLLPYQNPKSQTILGQNATMIYCVVMPLEGWGQFDSGLITDISVEYYNTCSPNKYKIRGFNHL
jgi:hypothetical protein